MQLVQRTVTRARRRLMLAAFIQFLGQFALAAVAAALLLVLTDRLLALAAPGWVYGVLAGLAVAAALVTAVITRPSRQHAAALVDDRLQLKDRLGTAMYAEALAENNPFARRVVEDAQQAASKARVARAFPLHLSRSWNAAAPLAVVALLGYWLLPQFDLAGIHAKQQQQIAQAAKSDAAVKQIALAQTIMGEVMKGDNRLSHADPTQLMDQLASISRRDLTTPGMREKTAAQLSDIQQRLSNAQQSLNLKVQTLQNSLSGIEPQTEGDADEFAKALRRGDFAKAQQELQRLADKFAKGDMSDEEKKQLAQQFQQMAQQLQQMAQQAQAQQAQMQQNIQQQLQQQGMSQQQINQLQQQGYNQQAVQQAVQQQLQQQGMNSSQAQQQAQQVAQQVQQMQSQSQGAGQCQNSGSSLSQSLQQMSQAMQQAQQGQGQQGQGQQGQGQQGQGQQGQGNQPGQQAQSQMQQGSWSAQQAINQMAQMQNQMQQMQQAQGQMQNAMQNLNNQSGQQSFGGKQNLNGSQGGNQAGTAEGGNPYGPMHNPSAYGVEHRQDIQDGKGRVIASWSENGEMAAGEATVEFDNAVTEAKAEAERAVTDDSVPRRYHNAIKSYFDQLPAEPDEVRQQAPPAAPR